MRIIPAAGTLLQSRLCLLWLERCVAVVTNTVLHLEYDNLVNLANDDDDLPLARAPPAAFLLEFFTAPGTC